jgi:hypothetical protein
MIRDLLPRCRVDQARERRAAVEVADLTGLDVAVLPGLTTVPAAKRTPCLDIVEALDLSEVES